MKTSLGICVFLIAITWIVFGQTLEHDFVNFDDKTYVYGDPVVTSGLTLPGIVWAFTHSHALNWHPLTTISHMLDCQLFGLRAGGHHLPNVLLHTIAVLLLFFVLRDMTSNLAVSGSGDAGRDQRSRLQQRSLWPSAFVAAVFAIHPLRVESVAWIAERKDVLSAVFFMLTLGAYVRYTRKPSIGRYLTMSILFACGLMSKPMLVTVPFVLLLLDYWPLNRVVDLGASDSRTGRSPSLQSRGFVWRDDLCVVRGLIIEKIPLFALSAASCVATIIAQRGLAGGMESLPITWRLENAVVSCVIYIGQMFWPARLAAFYPANSFPVWQVILSLAFLVAISAVAIGMRKKAPYIFTGWFWYLGMLVPVIGVFQIGLQSHADRYTYLPQIGLYLAITWSVTEILTFVATGLWPVRGVATAQKSLGIIAAILIVLLACRAFEQTRNWQNSETLWTHTLAVTSNNDIAHNNLGQFYVENGRVDDAISQYEAALKVRGHDDEMRYSLSNALVHNNLGNAFARKERLDDAISQYQKAITLRPDYANGHFNLGSALLQKGESESAIREFQATLSIHPNDVEAQATLGDALVRTHRTSDAIAHYQTALKFSPGSVQTLNKLAWIFSTAPDASLRNGADAIEFAGKADRYSDGKNPIVLRTLAAAYAEAGRFEEAIETAERAAELANAIGQTSLANRLGSDVDLYRGRSPVRDFSLTNGPSE
ncbi:MAG: tetratricopeptide repeat protein [Verrucomicrobiota bacterium]